MKRFLAILLLACLPVIGMAGEIKIDGPAAPVAVADVVTLGVLGIPDADLPKAVVSVTPATGATLRPIRSWANLPELLFVAKTPGTYRITVAVNGWREPITTSLTQAKAAAVGAPQLDRRYLTAIDSLTTDLVTNYPISSASCVVEVAGQNPTPPKPNPPDPPGPVVPVTDAVSALILYENDEKPAWLGTLEVMLRKDRELSPKVLILDKDAMLPNDEPVPMVLDALQLIGDKSLPVLLFRNASGSFVGGIEAVPQTYPALRERLKGGGL